MIEILNRQRTRRIPSTWRDFAERALRSIDKSHSSGTIVFVSDTAIKKLNKQFRGKDYATDVPSFPTQAEEFERQDLPTLGEIVISMDRAAAHAKVNGLSFTNEVQQLILHGLLHLCG